MVSQSNPSGELSAPKRRARGSLSRAEILGVARQFVETEGLRGLTFPRLAEHLNAGASSIYSYFRSKDEVIGSLIDDVTTEMYIQLPGLGNGPWDTEIMDHFVTFRDLLNRTPVYREVFAFRSQTLFQNSRMTPFIMRRIEENLALFVRAGLTPDEAVEAFNVLASYTRAFVLLEHAIDVEGDEQLHRLNGVVLKELAAGLGADDRDLTAAIENFAQFQTLGDELYRLGLGLIVAGLCREHPLLESGRSVTRAPAKAGK